MTISVAKALSLHVANYAAVIFAAAACILMH
jgi:hypothetical protein